MSIRRRVLFTVLALALLLMGALPAYAGTTKTSFSALEASCEQIPGEMWVSGNVLHIRGQANTERLSSAHPLGNATNYVVFNANINLTNGRGSGWGTFDYRPDGYDGAFVGTFRGTLFGGFHGTGVGHGTGVFDGMHLQAELTEIPLPPVHPCLPGPSFGAVHAELTIIDPGN